MLASTFSAVLGGPSGAADRDRRSGRAEPDDVRVAMRSRIFVGAALVAVGAIVGSSCASDDSSAKQARPTTTALGTGDPAAACAPRPFEPVKDGGEFTDYAQFDGLMYLKSFDPAAANSLAGAQITNALYDGLTEIDYSDACHPVVKPLVAKSFSANADSTEFAFVIKDGLKFSNGEPVLPSSFKKAWERAVSNEVDADFVWAFDFKDVDELQHENVTTLDSIVANDAEMTLKVSLRVGASDFLALVSSPQFSPIAQEDLEQFGTTTHWGELGPHIGNGPFRLESANTDGLGSVVLVRNERWAGNASGLKRAHLDRITFVSEQTQSAAYKVFDGGTGDSGPIPWKNRASALKKHPNTNGDPIALPEFLVFGSKDPQVGGTKNLDLRRAISLAIDREAIIQELDDGYGLVATGITPPGIPGYKAGLCEFCASDPDLAKDYLKRWRDAGGKLQRPIKISAPHEYAPMVQRIIEDINSTLGIEVEFGDYFEQGQVTEVACEICLAGRFPYFPRRRENLIGFHSASQATHFGGNLDDPEVDRLYSAMLAAPGQIAADEAGDALERRLLNELTVVAPIRWGTGNHGYRSNVRNYRQSPMGLIPWEYVGFVDTGRSGR